MKRKFVAGMFVVATGLGTLGIAAPAHAADVADNQGFCKQQGSSSCAGGSECSTAHIGDLPPGQQKKCE
jgi:hypothetical protein